MSMTKKERKEYSLSGSNAMKGVGVRECVW